MGDDMAAKSTAKGANSPMWKKALKGIHAAVFVNESENGSFPKATIHRVYKDGEEFKTTTSFSTQDMAVVHLLAGQAFEVMAEMESKFKKEE
jgi:hypothetical protein